MYKYMNHLSHVGYLISLMLEILRAGAWCCSGVCRRAAVLMAGARRALHPLRGHWRLSFLLWVLLPGVNIRGEVKVAITTSITWTILVHLICKLLSRITPFL